MAIRLNTVLRSEPIRFADPLEEAYGRMRAALLARAQGHPNFVAIIADGLEAWLRDERHEIWASKQMLLACLHHPKPHNLLQCLLDEIHSYRVTGYWKQRLPPSREAQEAGVRWREVKARRDAEGVG